MLILTPLNLASIIVVMAPVVYQLTTRLNLSSFSRAREETNCAIPKHTTPHNLAFPEVGANLLQIEGPDAVILSLLDG